VKKALATPRNGPKVQDVLLQMIEAEAQDEVLGPLVAGMASKSPKHAEASARAAREALVEFGVGGQRLVTACVDLFGSSTAAVRAEAIVLAQHLFLIMGPRISSHFDVLRPIQVLSYGACANSLVMLTRAPLATCANNQTISARRSKT
jgi:hypothetical protein